MNTYKITISVTFTEDSHTEDYAKNTFERFLRDNENVDSWHIEDVEYED